MHAIQFSLFGRLSTETLLPLGPAGLERSQALLDEVVVEVERDYRDLLAPAIHSVWDSEIAAIRTDLREWLRRMSADTSGFEPRHFELSFGLSQRTRRTGAASDASSRPDPVMLDAGLLLRGSIDLVERHPSGLLRVTDHKSGKADAKQDQVIAGGRSLQPVLYALAAEKLFGEVDAVTGGRLYFSTRRGNFSEVMVALDDDARLAAEQLTKTLDAALRTPFLPALPAPGECERCDYRKVCGPYEEQRAGRKPQKAIEALERLRNTR
jgi:CRISPR/Cas system-associated exonuclease Cas4 (RecB family)